MIRARKRSGQTRPKVGQTIIEYVLMLALLSTLTTGFIKFFTKTIFRDGLERLPDCANGLMSTGDNPNNCGDQR